MLNRFLRIFLVLTILIGCISFADAQIKYYGSLGYSKLYFRSRTAIVESTEGWLGYKIPNKTNGGHLTLVNGIKTANGKLSTGLGLGYLKFGSHNGYSIFSDNVYRLMPGTITPLIYGRLGYSDLKNQYPDGTGSFYGEFGVGLQVKVWSEAKLSVQTGFSNMQDVKFIPVSVQLSF